MRRWHQPAVTSSAHSWKFLNCPLRSCISKSMCRRVPRAHTHAQPLLNLYAWSLHTAPSPVTSLLPFTPFAVLLCLLPHPAPKSLMQNLMYIILNSGKADQHSSAEMCQKHHESASLTIPCNSPLSVTDSCN